MMEGVNFIENSSRNSNDFRKESINLLVNRSKTFAHAPPHHYLGQLGTQILSIMEILGRIAYRETDPDSIVPKYQIVFAASLMELGGWFIRFIFTLYNVMADGVWLADNERSFN